jgi:hypothetical protein
MQISLSLTSLSSYGWDVILAGFERKKDGVENSQQTVADDHEDDSYGEF